MGSPCHFALFDLQPAFRLDLDQLAARYRELARSVHPDRFADADEREQRAALEHSASLNEAYQVLKNASARARYLLGLRGGELPLEVTVQDGEFLLQKCRKILKESKGTDLMPVVHQAIKQSEQRFGYHEFIGCEHFQKLYAIGS